MVAPSIVVADDDATWPRELREFLAGSIDVRRAHNDERERIDRLCDVDRMLKHLPPENPYKLARTLSGLSTRPSSRA
jgi:hypothetical protein